MHGRKSLIEHQLNVQAHLKSTEVEGRGAIQLPVSSMMSMTSPISSVISSISGNIENNLNKEGLLKPSSKQPTANTKMDSVLSFGMARLLGEVQKKCEVGKYIL